MINKPKIICILGMHRSGTSALTRTLVKLGYRPGTKLLKESNFNKLGFYEDQEIIGFNNYLLEKNHLKWFLLQEDFNIKFTFYDLMIFNLMFLRKFSFSKKIVIKDPRISLLFPFYGYYFKKMGLDYSVIISNRNIKSIVKSLSKRNPDLQVDFYKLSEIYYNRIYNYTIEKCLNLEYEKMIKGDDLEISNFIKFIDESEKKKEIISQSYNLKLKTF